MIDIRIAENCIILKTLERNHLARAVELYNCDSNIYYATGFYGQICLRELDEKYNLIESSENEFLVGVHIRRSETDAGCEYVLAGLISGGLQDNSVWVKLMLISPEYRNNGIGTKTLSLLLQYFKEFFDARDAFLSVVKGKHAAMNFWIFNGFSEVRSINKKICDEQHPEQIAIMHKKI